MDDFLRDLDRAQRNKMNLMTYLQDRETKQKSGEATGALNEKLRGGVSDLAVDLDALINQLNSYEKNPEKYKIPPNEINRRRVLVTELESDFNNIQDRVREGYKQAKSSPGINFKREKNQEESAETKNLSNKDLQSAQTQMLSSQGQLEDQLIGVADNLLVAARGIGDEVDIHNRLLEDTDKNVDYTQAKMDKTNFKMKELIMKSSDGCLLLFIVILILAIVLVLVLL